MLSAAPAASSSTSSASLRFDSHFESGSIGSVRSLDGLEYEISIRSDTRNPRYQVWFYFRITNTKLDQRVILHLSGYSKSFSLLRQGFTPVIKSSSNPHWRQIPGQNVSLINNCTKHSNTPLCVSCTCICLYLQFSNPRDEYFIAYSYPYTYSDLMKFITTRSNKQPELITKKTIGASVLGHSIELIKIAKKTEKNEAGKFRTVKRRVFVTARVHPGETGASFVIEGLINFLLSSANEPSSSSSLLATSLLDSVIFYIVPMLNPDGVTLGNYRCNSLGVDLNRVWANPNNFHHPTITAVKQLIFKEILPNHSLDLVLDIHTHTTKFNCFLYANPSTPLLLPQLLHEFHPQYFENPLSPINQNSASSSSSLSSPLSSPTMKPLNSPIYSQNHANKKGTSRMAIGESLGEFGTHCFTLECSVFGALQKPKSPVSDPLEDEKQSNSILRFTDEEYRDIGRCLGETLVSYFRLDSLESKVLDQGKIKLHSQANPKSLKSSPSVRQFNTKSGIERAESAPLPHRVNNDKKTPSYMKKRVV
jgi:hypothetical protein